MCPGFWEWLILTNKNEITYSIEKVGNELKAGDDELAAWVKEQGEKFFLSPTQEMIKVFDRPIDWASKEGYHDSAIKVFSENADLYLIAFALAHKHKVVTFERPANTKKKIKISNACIGLGIEFLTPFEMLRLEKARFVLEK